METTKAGATTTAFPLYDAHGNQAARLSRSGTGYQVSDRVSLDAWGLARQQQSGTDRRMQHCASLGHQMDEYGLIYMRARYYAPECGRFVSEDPARDGGNWFAYCSNDPVNASDSDGRKAMSAMEQAAIVGMLFGFFSALSFDGTYGALGGNGGVNLWNEAQAGAWAAAGNWALATIGKMFMSTEGLGSRVPLRVGYAKGFAAVAMTGVGVGVVMAVAKRSGEVMAYLFMLDYDGFEALP